MNMKKYTEKQEKVVKDWNEKNSVGIDVIVTKDDMSEVVSKTRSQASIVGGTAVIWLEEFRGCYMLERVRLAETKEDAHNLRNIVSTS